MNNDIKEILDKLEIVARKHTIEVCEDGSKIETMPASVVDELRLNNYSSKILLDYITNLEEEIKYLNNMTDYVKELQEEYKTRCVNAIDYCNDCLRALKNSEENICEGVDVYTLDVIINILKDGDK